MTKFKPSNWKPYNRENSSTYPKNEDLYLVRVDKNWGGNKRIHFASFTGTEWIPRDEAPVPIFDKCVTHWHELPEDIQKEG